MAREQSRDLNIAFIDFTKAYDTGNREFLLEVLQLSGCPPKFVNIVRQFHDGMKNSVIMVWEESDCFHISSGVKQISRKAPVLFNIYLDYVKMLLHNSLQERNEININFRLNDSLFNIRKFQSKTKSFTGSRPRALIYGWLNSRSRLTRGSASCPNHYCRSLQQARPVNLDRKNRCTIITISWHNTPEAPNSENKEEETLQWSILQVL